MSNINPSAPKCRDIILRLCGQNLQTQRTEWSTQHPDAGFQPSFSVSPPHSASPGIDSWMTEIDTAIHSYDVYCDRLSNAALAGTARGLRTENGSAPGDEAAAAAAGGAVGVAGWGNDIGTGVPGWDWSLMLS